MAGFAGTDVLRGGPGNDELDDYGGERDVLDGGPGADLLDGGPGLDRMAGGRGNDELTLGAASLKGTSCGAGRDFVVGRFAGALVPDDCERLRLSAIDEDLTVVARRLVRSRSVSLRVPAVCYAVGCKGGQLTVLVGRRVVGRGQASLSMRGVDRVRVRAQVSRASARFLRRARVLTLRLRFTGPIGGLEGLEWRVRRRPA